MPKLSGAPYNLGSIPIDERHRILELAIQHENEKRIGSSIMPILLIDTSVFKDHLKNENIDERYHQARYQLIVKTGYHYTAVDIDKREGSKSLIVLDAVGDLRGGNLGRRALKQGYETTLVGGFSWDVVEYIQKDSHSCSMFSFDHCVQLGSTIPDFHKKIRRDSFMTDDDDEENDRMLYWDKLPPNFIWNAQSRKILEKYEGTKKEGELDLIMPNGMSYREYIERGICTYVDEEGEEVTRNESINVTVLHKVIADIGASDTSSLTRDFKAQLGSVGAKDKEVAKSSIDIMPT